MQNLGVSVDKCPFPLPPPPVGQKFCRGFFVCPTPTTLNLWLPISQLYDTQLLEEYSQTAEKVPQTRTVDFGKVLKLQAIVPATNSFFNVVIELVPRCGILHFTGLLAHHVQVRGSADTACCPQIRTCSVSHCIEITWRPHHALASAIGLGTQVKWRISSWVDTTPDFRFCSCRIKWLDRIGSCNTWT